MFHHSAEQDVTFKTRFHWFLLAFLSGCVNAGGFLACKRFVSHVTGFATLFGVDMAQGRYDAAIGILSVPLYFLLGVVISANLVDRQHQEGRRPHYATVMSLVAACLILAAAGGYLGYFSTFGELKLKQDYFLLALLCMASGLQNATITTATGATVRTTHLTGITTDLGLGLVRAMDKRLHEKRREKERRSNNIRIGTIASFAVGSTVSALVCLKIGYLGLLLPAAISLYCVAVALRDTSHFSHQKEATTQS